MNINEIERLKKLSGITAVTEAAATKYADHDKASLNKVKSELQGVMALANRASFKYKNAAEELKLVNDCLKQLEEPEKKDVTEGADVVEPVVEAKKDDDKDEKDSKEDKKDSDEKKDEDKDSKEDDKTDKDEKKDSDKEDDKPAFLKDKKDDKDEDDKSDKKEDKDSDEKKDDDKKSDKKEDKDDSDKEEKSDKKDDDKEDKDEDGDKTVKVEVKVEEQEDSVEDIVARIMETDLTPTNVEVDYENGPTENSGIKYERGTKIRLPNAVKSVVKDRIKQLDDAILRYDDKGYDDKSIKQQAVDCLNQILQDLSTGDLEGLKKAQIYFGTLMSPLTDFFPPQLINWLANANNQYVADVE